MVIAQIRYILTERVFLYLPAARRQEVGFFGLRRYETVQFGIPLEGISEYVARCFSHRKNALHWTAPTCWKLCRWLCFEKIPKAPSTEWPFPLSWGDRSCNRPFLSAGQGNARRLLSTRSFWCVPRCQGTITHTRSSGGANDDTVKAEPGDVTQAVIRIQDAPYLGT